MPFSGNRDVSKRLTSNFKYILYLKLDVNVLGSTDESWAKGMFQNVSVLIQVQNVPELGRQRFKTVSEMYTNSTRYGSDRNVNEV